LHNYKNDCIIQLILKPIHSKRELLNNQLLDTKTTLSVQDDKHFTLQIKQ